MAIIRIIITLKQGVLDVQGQAVQQGLRALGYGAANDVKVGRYIEVTVPDAYPPDEINQMCERLLANPLIEEWRIENAGNAETRKRGNGERRRSEPRTPNPEHRGVH